MLAGLETLRYEESGGVAHVTLLRDRVDVRVVRELAKVSEHLEDDAAGAGEAETAGPQGRFGVLRNGSHLQKGAYTGALDRVKGLDPVNRARPGLREAKRRRGESIRLLRPCRLG